MTDLSLLATNPDGAFVEVDEDVYHADRGSLSVSGAKLLLPPSCPEKFKWAMDHTRKSKKVFDFGHVAHRLLLGKGGEIAVLDPKVHGLTKDKKPSTAPANTEMWKTAAADARAAGATPIHIDEYRLAEVMAAKVLADPDAGPLFAEGVAEQSFYWTDPVTGVQLRGRVDWLSNDGIVDYKTSETAEPKSLERKFWKLGYHRQAAWYMDLLDGLGIGGQRFRFVVAEKDAPHVVSVVEYDDEAIDAGRLENRQAIELYARCRDNNVWPAYSDGPAIISAPRYALNAVRAEADQQAAQDLIAELEGIYSDDDN